MKTTPSDHIIRQNDQWGAVPPARRALKPRVLYFGTLRLAIPAFPLSIPLRSELSFVFLSFFFAPILSAFPLRWPLHLLLNIAFRTLWTWPPRGPCGMSDEMISLVLAMPGALWTRLHLDGCRASLDKRKECSPLLQAPSW